MGDRVAAWGERGAGTGIKGGGKVEQNGSFEITGKGRKILATLYF